jgi:hypothetical protein
VVVTIQVFLIGDLDFDVWINLLAFGGVSLRGSIVRLIIGELGHGAGHLKLIS